MFAIDETIRQIRNTILTLKVLRRRVGDAGPT